MNLPVFFPIGFVALLAGSALATAAVPRVDTPAAYRDAPVSMGAWKLAEPADAHVRGAWWNVFADSMLDELESRALIANQDLRAAAARVEQAQAAAGLARSAAWPHVAVEGSVSRERTSRVTDNVLPNPLTTAFRLPLTLAWEIDLFGRVRRLSESARADAAASAATFESIRLALTAEVAAHYFTWRALERELALLERTVALRDRAREIIAHRLKSGAAAEVDLVRAETELALAETDRLALVQRRATVQNSLAVLLGESAPTFALSTPSRPLPSAPLIPPGLPSELLERRPDIAAAERALAAANARIGVAKAAFFPAITLTGAGGYASGEIDTLFGADARAWSIGPSLYLPIFQGGRNRANLERSRAIFAETVAQFRQRVLVAFREVQDALTATRLLEEQQRAQARALASARRTVALVQVRYDAGYISYLEVIEAQRTLLATERSAVQLDAAQLNASVALLKALGGGWHELRPDLTLAQQ